MKKQQIPFDFTKWGQEGISVESSDFIVHTLHLHPHNKDNCYGIAHNGDAFNFHVGWLRMYQEIKPREIWVNEYSTGFGIMHFTEEAAIQQRDKARTFVKLVKFREVLEDEQ